MITITEEVESAFGRWQRRLVARRSAQDTGALRDRQLALRDAARGGAEPFVKYIEEELQVTVPSGSSLPQMFQVTTAEAFNPPAELERRLADAWTTEITPRQAAQPVHWTLSYAGWFKSGILGDDPIGVLVTGKSSSSNKNPDEFTRTLLRNMGGLSHVRGPVSVFSDCPLSRAWWRVRIASEAAATAPSALTRETAHVALHRNPIWETLVSLAVRRVTVVNSRTARAALVALIAERDGLKPKELVEIVWLVGARGQALVFDQMSWDEVCEIVDAAATRVLGDRSTPARW